MSARLRSSVHHWLTLLQTRLSRFPEWTAESSFCSQTDSSGSWGNCRLNLGLVMARSANRSGKDGDSRVSAPAERGEIRELSLEEVLKSYEQPINEEQAWAVCFQCCRELRAPRPDTQPAEEFLIRDLSSIILHRDGTVTVHLESSGKDLTFIYWNFPRAQRCPSTGSKIIQVEEFLFRPSIFILFYFTCILGSLTFSNEKWLKLHLKILFTSK